MSRIIIFLGVFFVISLSTLITGWDHYALVPQSELDESKREPSKLSNNTEYCFHFTWMGERFNNRTFKNIRNKTCNQYFKDKKTLCINPMVATFKGYDPDIDYLLENYPKESTCRLSQGQVCVKYTVTNNGITSYQTRYCSVVFVEAEGPMQTGCITEKRGSELIEVCACRSLPGPKGICNSANLLSPTGPIFSFLLLTGTYLFMLK